MESSTGNFESKLDYQISHFYIWAVYLYVSNVL